MPFPGAVLNYTVLKGLQRTSGANRTSRTGVYIGDEPSGDVRIRALGDRKEYPLTHDIQIVPDTDLNPGQLKAANEIRGS